MDAVIIGRICQETAIPDSSVSATVALFEKGATGPFIVHYRKEATGGLDEAKVRLIQERMDYYREVRDKQTALIKSLSEQGKLTDEIRARIESYLTKVELDDLLHQYRSKKKTRSAEAIEKGLEPLAEYFWHQEPDAWSVEEHIKVFVESSRELSTPEQALQGVVDIIAEWIGENSEYRRTLREMLEKDGFLISNVVPAKVNQKTKYNMYYERRESVRTIPSHRVLAIRRGCKEGILISSIEGDHSKALEFLLASVIKDRESIFAPVLEAAVHESYNRILKPVIETEVRTQLKERADREAIRVFQENLTSLLLSPPAGPIVVMGVDCGKDEECSVAVVDENGTFLEGTKVRFKPSAKNARNKKEITVPRKADARDAVSAVQESDSGAPSDSSEAETPETDPQDATNVPDSAAAGTERESPSGAGTGETVLLKDEAFPEEGDKEEQTPAGKQEELPEEPIGPGQVSPAVEAAAFTEIIQTELTVAPAASETVIAAAPPNETGTVEPVTDSGQHEPERTAQANIEGISGAGSTGDATIPPSEIPEIADAARNETPGKEPVSEVDASPAPPADRESAAITDTPSIEPLVAPKPKEEELKKEEAASAIDGKNPGDEFEKTRGILKDLITRHKVRALSIGTGPKSRELETVLRRIVAEENLGDILIAAVNDAGIAIYSSSRVAREEFPDWHPSARCALSLARRLQDPLAELVKIDPKLIGVGQYQHDVDQKELHRKLLRTVQFCVNKVGVNVNTAGEPLLRYVSGLNEKIARRITTYRKNQGPFSSRESIPAAVGMDAAVYQQAAGFIRIPNSENILDRTAIHPESYPIVRKMASAVGLEINDLAGNREKIKSLNLEDFKTDSVGIPTIKDIRDELLKPGRDPRKTFKLPKFSPDVKEMSDLKMGITLEGTVTNVTNFGAFVDIGVQQDGLVHLSQMSNRFIRDPREAVKVGDIVQVKVISVETETKRIGLSMKALMPAVHRRRRKQQRNAAKQAHTDKKADRPGPERKAGAPGPASPPSADKRTDPRGRSKPNRPHGNASKPRKKAIRKPDNSDGSIEKKESAPEIPEHSLQEKIAILQSKFRRIN